MADEISSILTVDQLRTLQAAYVQSKSKLMDAMAASLPKRYALASAYIDAVSTIFYKPQPNALSEADRERCIVALLAARDADLNLALHMYLALMEGVAPSEIAHILLLAAVYSGVESFSDGIEVEATLLKLLAKQLTSNKPVDGLTIFGMLLSEPPPLGIRRY